MWPALESVINEKQIDLLVLGSRGRTGMGKILLGSVAEEIVRQAACPVLTVAPHSPSEPPLEGRFREILYATDFSEALVAAAPGRLPTQSWTQPRSGPLGPNSCAAAIVLSYPQAQPQLILLLTYSKSIYNPAKKYWFSWYPLGQLNWVAM